MPTPSQMMIQEASFMELATPCSYLFHRSVLLSIQVRHYPRGHRFLELQGCTRNGIVLILNHSFAFRMGIGTKYALTSYNHTGFNIWLRMSNCRSHQALLPFHSMPSRGVLVERTLMILQPMLSSSLAFHCSTSFSREKILSGQA